MRIQLTYHPHYRIFWELVTVTFLTLRVEIKLVDYTYDWVLKFSPWDFEMIVPWTWHY